jgi:hypothetical protein
MAMQAALLLAKCHGDMAIIINRDALSPLTATMPMAEKDPQNRDEIVEIIISLYLFFPPSLESSLFFC